METMMMMKSQPLPVIVRLQCLLYQNLVYRLYTCTLVRSDKGKKLRSCVFRHSTDISHSLIPKQTRLVFKLLRLLSRD